MPKGTFHFSKPGSVHQSRSLRFGAHLWEADSHSATPGALCGSVQLIDESQNIVYSRELTRDEAERVNIFLGPLKKQAMGTIGARFEPDPEPVIEPDPEADEPE